LVDELLDLGVAGRQFEKFLSESQRSVTVAGTVSFEVNRDERGEYFRVTWVVALTGAVRLQRLAGLPRGVEPDGVLVNVAPRNGSNTNLVFDSIHPLMYIETKKLHSFQPG
jgi:hypothetical protein